MKKRILALLLAVCMVAGLLPMTVLATDTEEEEITATLKVSSGTNANLSQWAPTLSEGMTAQYAKTVDGDVTTDGASESDWNLKVEWATDGTPTLTLKNAVINNDNVNYDTYGTARHDTISIGGTTDFVIKLSGTNEFYCNKLNSIQQAAYRFPAGISGNNTGTLTIKGDSQADSLLIDTVAGNGIIKFYNALAIETSYVKVLGDATHNNGPANISLTYGTDDCKDKTNLTVSNAKLHLEFSKPSGYTNNNNCSIRMCGSDANTVDTANSGDILFENSDIYISRSNNTGSSSNYAFRLGTDSTITIDRCDVYVYSWATAFKSPLTITNYASATYSDKGTGTSGNVYNPENAGTVHNIYKLEVTHACLEGDPVAENVVSGATCATSHDVVTYCTICGEEMSRESEELTATKSHHWGSKVELEDQRVAAALDPNDTEGDGNYIKEGKYVFQYTCSVCGETKTEEETFKPAALNYMLSSAQTTGTNTNWHGAGWANQSTTSSSYKPKKVISAGQTVYFETTNCNESYTSYYYLVELDATEDAEKIAAGEWNVKLEYPLYGEPVLTLKNATVINDMGLWYGYASYKDFAPLTVVLEGTNTFSQPVVVKSGLLNFRTINDVTITGDGKLIGTSNDNSGNANAGIIQSLGNLTFDHADIYLTKVDRMTTSNGTQGAIVSHDGDITIDGGTIETFIYCPQTVIKDGVSTEVKTYRGTRYGISAQMNDAGTAGGNVTIKNGAKVQMNVSLGGDGYGVIDTEGNLTIIDSDVTLSHGGYGYGDAIVCDGEFSVSYVNGFTAGAINSRFTCTDGVVTHPTPTTTYTDVADIPAEALAYYSFYITGNTDYAALPAYYGVRLLLQNNLAMQFGLAISVVDSDGYVVFSRNGVDEEPVSLSSFYKDNIMYYISYNGIFAQEMTDVITASVYDKDGNLVCKPRSESVQSYAMNELRKSTNASDTALLTLLVDLLDYGTMAQVQFAGATADYANAELTPTEWLNASTAGTYESVAAQITGDSSIYFAARFVLGNSISAQIGITDSTISHAEATIVTSSGTNTVQITGVAFGGGIYAYEWAELYPQDAECEITWKFYREGDTDPCLTVVDSLANYLGRMVSSYPYMEELVRYCDAAAAYAESVS